MLAMLVAVACKTLTRASVSTQVEPSTLKQREYSPGDVTAPALIENNPGTVYAAVATRAPPEEHCPTGASATCPGMLRSRFELDRDSKVAVEVANTAGVALLKEAAFAITTIIRARILVWRV